MSHDVNEANRIANQLAGKTHTMSEIREIIAKIRGFKNWNAYTGTAAKQAKKCEPAGELRIGTFEATVDLNGLSPDDPRCKKLIAEALEWFKVQPKGRHLVIKGDGASWDDISAGISIRDRLYQMHTVSMTSGFQLELTLLDEYSEQGVAERQEKVAIAQENATPSRVNYDLSGYGPDITPELRKIISEACASLEALPAKSAMHIVAPVTLSLSLQFWGLFRSASDEYIHPSGVAYLMYEGEAPMSQCLPWLRGVTCVMFAQNPDLAHITFRK